MRTPPGGTIVSRAAKRVVQPLKDDAAESHHRCQLDVDQEDRHFHSSVTGTVMLPSLFVRSVPALPARARLRQESSCFFFAAAACYSCDDSTAVADASELSGMPRDRRNAAREPPSSTMMPSNICSYGLGGPISTSAADLAPRPDSHCGPQRRRTGLVRRLNGARRQMRSSRGSPSMSCGIRRRR